MRDDIDLSRRRVRAWLRLLRVTRQTENHLREFLRVHHKTTLPRFDVMAALHRAGAPMKMSDVSRQLLVSNGNATTVVERLENDGLARRIPGTQDRRVVMVELTARGRAEFEAQAEGHAVEIDQLFAGLDPSDLDHLRDLTRRIDGSGNSHRPNHGRT